MSKITPAAARRCTQHTLQDQLAALRFEPAPPEPTGPDTSWGGQHARLSKGKGWDQPDPQTASATTIKVTP